MNTESLIFDIDGTLWDSRARVAEGYNIQLKAEGLDHLCVTKDDLTPLFGKVLTAIADSILASVPKEARYGMMQRLMDTENEHLVRMPCDFGYPNVKQTMERLSKKHRLFIVSNSQCGYPDICIEKLGLTGLIEGHLCFGDTGTEKGETIRRLMKEPPPTSATPRGTWTPQRPPGFPSSSPPTASEIPPIGTRKLKNLRICSHCSGQCPYWPQYQASGKGSP